MIMPRGQQLLLPARPVFIWSSLMAALALNMLQNMALWGRAAWLPDMLAVVLVFWVTHQPQRIGVGTAFALGLAMDIHQSALLGQHALAYTALSFLANIMHRRLLWFTVPNQTVQVLPLFLLAHALTLVVRLLAGGVFPSWSIVLAPFIEALLWPLVSVLLLLPQRQAPDPDANRPL
ncbi:rod shape-determining protein MreD [Rhodoferax sp.]|uniref:rod shape-determining protein MreD n=1 Tax=Rhodoferax sp. TaxID=50421 RepID=UPI00261483DC|nr:rod shape-determining protein MreD [Rhodoferax sp.]MDD2926359.1 rod shape-determining protein MreD [Rhodoferax sp.]